MTIEEKIKFIEEHKEKNYLFVSPRIIQGGAKLIYDFETLELYENMKENTKIFSEKIIVDLISSARYNDKEIQHYLRFNLIYAGDFSDLPNTGSFADFIMKNKDRIIAVYKYVKSTEQRNFFIGFAGKEIIHKYGYFYLDFSKLLEEFEKNNIKYEIDKIRDRFSPSIHNDDSSTNFAISYNPKKEVADENNHQLKIEKKGN